MARRSVMRSDEARADALDAFLRDMDKERPGEVRRLSDTSALDVEVIPTGAISLDVALGAGGLPRGKIVELYGPEMSGKTSLALSAAAQAQADGENVGFVDAEHALNPEHVRAMGGDPTRLVLYQPTSGEDGLSMVAAMCESGAFALVIIDSVAALTPQAEIDGEMGDMQVGAQARLMSKAMRKLNAVASETRTCLVFINQLREKIGQLHGNPETTPGGRALKFYSSVRIEVRSPASKRITRDKVVVGQECAAKVVKNKVGPPHRVAEYELYFGAGIARGGALLDVCESLGLVERKGASYTDTTTGERIAVGKDAAKAVLESDEAMFERLTGAVYAALAPVAPDPDSYLDADPDADEDGDFDEAELDDATPDITGTGVCVPAPGFASREAPAA